VQLRDLLPFDVLAHPWRAERTDVGPLGLETKPRDATFP
jgi:hypothetical protein